MNVNIRSVLLSAILILMQFAPPAWCAPTAQPSPKKPSKSVVKIDPRAEKILRKMTDTYKSAVSLSAKMSIDMVISKGSDQQKLPGDYIISIAKPNRYSIELASTRSGKAVSNGRRSEFYYKPENIYMIAPSLATFAENFDTHEFRYVTAGLVNFSYVRELMETNPYAAMMEDTDQLQYVGAEQVSHLDCDHLRLSQGEHYRDIWISRGTTPLLIKVKPNMNVLLPPQARAAGNDISLSFTYRDQVFNKPMNDGRFETAHQPGAKFQRKFFHEEGAEFIGKKAPDVTLSMADGSKIKLSSLKDRLVVLDFWATWCEPCVVALPVFAKVAEKFKSKGVVFIAVNKGENAATAKSFFKLNKIHATLALDPDEKVCAAFNTDAIPTTIFIGRDGVVKGVHTGLSPSSLSETFAEDLNKFIAGKSLKRQ